MWRAGSATDAGVRRLVRIGRRLLDLLISHDRLLQPCASESAHSSSRRRGGTADVKAGRGCVWGLFLLLYRISLECSAGDHFGPWSAFVTAGRAGAEVPKVMKCCRAQDVLIHAKKHLSGCMETLYDAVACQSQIDSRSSDELRDQSMSCMPTSALECSFPDVHGPVSPRRGTHVSRFPAQW